MKNLSRILVYLESNEHAEFLIEKALKLRDFAEAELLFTRTIFDEMLEEPDLGFTQAEQERIIKLEKEAEEIKFRHVVATHATDNNWGVHLRWSKRSWQGILEVASDKSCDLIVKDTYMEGRQNGEINHALHDWNLLHHSTLPVMMINPAKWPKEGNILTAIDVFDSYKTRLNHHVLRYATSLTDMIGGALHVVNALPLSKRIVLENHGEAYYEKMLKELTAQREKRIECLLADTVTHDAVVHVVHGGASEVVTQMVDEVNAEFLVIGKVKPSVSNYLGTTAERLLHSVNCDIVSVPWA